MPRQFQTLIIACLSISTLFANNENTKEAEASTQFISNQTCSQFGSLLKLYKEQEGQSSYVKEFNLVLSMQYQWGWTEPHGQAVKRQGGGRQDEWKIFRFGFNTKLFTERLKVNYVWNMGGLEGRYLYHGNSKERMDLVANLYLANVEYTADECIVALGLMTAPITTEYRTSSTAIITQERSVLVNQLRPESNFGIQVKNAKKDDAWGWCAGLYLNGVEGGDRMDEPDFSTTNNAFVLLSGSYDTSTWIPGVKSRLWLDYTHSFADDRDRRRENRGSSSYRGPGARDVFALSWDMTSGEWACVTELLLGLRVNNTPTFYDYSQQTVWGFIWMPSYKLTPQWEFVGRYQFSRGNDAVRSEPRYITSGSASSTTNAAAFADQMQAVYLGVNYYFCPENPNMMKIMTGVEYADYHNEHGLNADGLGFTGWSYYVSLRMNF